MCQASECVQTCDIQSLENHLDPRRNPTLWGFKTLSALWIAHECPRTAQALGFAQSDHDHLIAQLAYPTVENRTMREKLPKRTSLINLKRRRLIRIINAWPGIARTYLDCSIHHIPETTLFEWAQS